jgi:hypothetical protein
VAYFAFLKWLEDDEYYQVQKEGGSAEEPSKEDYFWALQTPYIQGKLKDGGYTESELGEYRKFGPRETYISSDIEDPWGENRRRAEHGMPYSRASDSRLGKIAKKFERRLKG